MGLTVLALESANPARPAVTERMDLLIDPGAITLEALGLSLDPIRRELEPLPLILAAV
jgi:hypothetical protein